MNKTKKKSSSPALNGVICLVIVIGFFAYLGISMGMANMLNTVMKTAHDLLINTVFYLMSICVLMGALSRLFAEFGVVSILEKLLRPLMKPLFNLPGVASLGAVMTFLSDNPAIISLSKDKRFSKYFKKYQLISLTNFGTAFGMGLIVIVFMMGQGFFKESLIGLFGAFCGCIVSTRLMQRFTLKAFPQYLTEEACEGIEEEEAEEKEEEKKQKEQEKEKLQYLSSFNARKFKKLVKEHQVKQKHVFAMVDSYPAEKIQQAPAIVWRTDHYLHLLIMDRSAREFKIPFNDIKGVHYHKNMPADPEQDYLAFQYSGFMTGVYKPYLPEYKQNTKNGHIVYVKNLFTIHPGISFTNTSMKGIFSILTRAPFLVDDAVNTSGRFDEYFKDIYRYGILCKNNVYTLEEYRQKMESVLEELVEAPVTRDQFFRTLNAMNNYHLITQEYVTKYTQKYVMKHN